MKEMIFTVIGRWREPLERYKYVLLVVIAGVLLMLLPAGEEETMAQTRAACPEDSFDVEAFEGRLEDTLSRIDGAGEVKVILSLRGGSRQVLAQDEEWEGDGSLSASTVTVGEGAGMERVVPLQTVAPEFRGALVLCPGGGDAHVRLELARAVSALTGLGTDRISICAGNT